MSAVGHLGAPEVGKFDRPTGFSSRQFSQLDNESRWACHTRRAAGRALVYLVTAYSPVFLICTREFQGAYCYNGCLPLGTMDLMVL